MGTRYEQARTCSSHAYLDRSSTWVCGIQPRSMPESDESSNLTQAHG
jgi:hypothetical protein